MRDLAHSIEGNRMGKASQRGVHGGSMPLKCDRYGCGHSKLRRSPLVLGFVSSFLLPPKLALAPSSLKDLECASSILLSSI